MNILNLLKLLKYNERFFIMSEKETVSITSLQKELLSGHLEDMNKRLQIIAEETSFLSANFKAVELILDNTSKVK